MKKQSNSKLKIFLITIFIIALVVGVYISLPNTSFALNFFGIDNLNEVGKITWEHQDESEMTTTKIRQHYGYTVQRQSGGVSYVENEYVETETNTNCLGILNIDSYISSYLSPGLGNPNNPPTTYVWYNSLKQNSSIFCQQNGTPFPDLGDRILQMFHANDSNTNEVKSKNVKREDRVEYFMNLAECPTTLEILWKDLELNTIETTGEDVQENDLGFGIGESSKMYQYTLVRVSYVANPKDRKLDTIEAYIASYSDRNLYKNDVAQKAMWAYKNGKDSNDLFIAATAVDNSLVGTTTVNGEEVRIPVFPEMQKTTDDTTGLSTGTILDEEKESYKVGPIGMNAYSYSWCDEAANYSGELICGIVEMTVKLDNGKTITLDSLEDFEYVPGSQDSQYINQSETIEIEYVTRVCKHSDTCTSCGKKLVGYETLKDSDGNVIDLKSPVYEDVCVHDSNCDGNCINSEEVTEKQTVTYSISPEEEDYIFPTPNSKFYIHLPLEDCKEATKVEEIKAVYKWTTADGQGGDLIGKYDKILWESQGISRIDREYTGMAPECKDNYNCTTCNHSGLSYESYALGSEPAYSEDCLSTYFNGSLYDGDATKIKHAWFCGGTANYCEYTKKSGAHYHCSEVDGTCDDSCGLHKCGGCTTCGEQHSCSNCSGTGELDCDEDCPEDCDGEHSCGSCGGDGEKLCSNNSCYCPGEHKCEKVTGNYCEHGFKNGEHYNKDEYKSNWAVYDASRDQCDGEALCSDHEHNWCMRLVWLSKDIIENVASQKLIYIRKAKVDEHTLECYVRDIPLVAKVEIRKYIDDVKHASKEETYNGIDTTYTGTDSLNRSGLTEGTKQLNPVYVETNDWVIYKIEVENFSAFGVKVRVDDILPAQANVGDVYDYATIIIGDKVYTEELKQIRNQEIEIDAGKTSEILVELQVKADNKFVEGSNVDVYENKAKIITRNAPFKTNSEEDTTTTDEITKYKDSITDDEPNDIDYVKTAEDDGPVVLHKNVQADGSTDLPQVESSDWFKLNTYNIFVDKYVYAYDEKILNDNNAAGISKEDEVTEGTENKLIEKIGEEDFSRKNTSQTTSEVNDGNINNILVRDDNNSKEQYKEDHPVNVEQEETITYAIRVSNEAEDISKTEETGTKFGTQVKDIRIKDILDDGLVYAGKISGKIFEYNDDGTVKEIGEIKNISCGGSGNTYYIEAPDTILNPNQYLEFYMEVKVVQSNMYLFSMANSAELVSASNINSNLKYKDNKGNEKEDVVKIFDKDSESINRLISKQTTSKEFVRMKDLLIAGRVWIDFNKDGYMNEPQNGRPTSLEQVNNNVNNKAMKENILVKLYRVEGDTATPIRQTRTDENGLYTFARKEGTNQWYDTFNHTVDYEADGTEINEAKYQRIDKAAGKDQNGNYTAGSENKYYSYFVEFVYDGVLYRSTDIYSDNTNLNTNGTFKDKHDSGNELYADYQLDSNAMERVTDREEFNRKYEYISYNVAYGIDASGKAHDKTTASGLVFQKDVHESYLMENQDRAMTAKSFVTKGSDQIKYLWLYPLNTATFTKNGQDYKGSSTDYLKFINLGLELREDVDLALTKDIYKIKTTINGEEMEYDYNQVDGINGNITEDASNKYLQNYIIKQPYGFEIYESDYKYRVDQHLAAKVREYKGETGLDELNLEVTFRMTLDNVSTTDDDLEPNANNTKFDVKVHEVVDLYDENFKEYIEDAIVKMKTKDAEGYLVDKTINVAEAWMFKESVGNSDLVEVKIVDSITKDVTIKYVKYEDAIFMTNTKILKYKEVNGIFYLDDDGTHMKKGLKLSKTSEFLSDVGANNKASTDKISGNNNFKANGYNTLYITGMGDEVIREGEDGLDIFVKYVLDKDKLEIDVTSENVYNETKSVDLNSTRMPDGTIVNEKVVTVISNSEAYLHRAIKIAEKIADKLNARGIEGIGQINAYSVWYQENEKPASLVDKDSNAGNIGIKNTFDAVTGNEVNSPKGDKYEEELISADNITYYEDTTYKTGIEIYAEGTENTPDNVINRYPEKEIIPNPDPIIRKINGTVWDDARSEVLGTDDEYKTDIQYIGNGEFGTGTKQESAKSNDNVTYNYKDNSVTEKEDIAVRNAKAEFVEIVEVPIRDSAGNVTEVRYYEEVLTDVTWNQAQHVRTDENGKYELCGMRPGNYIVRFTYGDTIEENRDGSYDAEIEAQRDMLIFNGQDYKSTKFSEELLELENDEVKAKDVDEIIKALESEKYSDARDDEYRRLEVNEYSEVMTNKLAEILKGYANGRITLTNEANEKFKPYQVKNTGNYSETGSKDGKNSAEELELLTLNTYMTAETPEFLIKTEKLVDEKEKVYSKLLKLVESSIYYKELDALMNSEVNSRNFILENVDFGIEYRPESEISLLKEISEIILTPEGYDQPLVHLFFNSDEYDGVISHSIDEKKSVGFEKVQFITNNYYQRYLINNAMSEEDVQGLVYLQVDKEILQGCTVKIIYSFKAQNQSEIDRISINLNNIRYKDNEATKVLEGIYGNDIYDIKSYRLPPLYEKTGLNTSDEMTEGLEKQKYTASGVARNIIYMDNYSKADSAEGNRGINSTGVYRTEKKTMTETGNEGYFGRFVGYGYYTGKLSNLDTIATLKFDKILDYIDTDLVYEPDPEQIDVTNRLWAPMVAKDLENMISVIEYKKNQLITVGKAGMVDKAHVGTYEIKTENGKDKVILKDTFTIENIDGKSYKYLVVSIDDRTSDQQSDSDVKNNMLSKFLVPKVHITGVPKDDGSILDNDTVKENIENYGEFSGMIYLDTSKVLNPENDEDDMTYENMAEIIQFTTLTGRRTNFATTIGNANLYEVQNKITDPKEPPFEDDDSPNAGSIEFMTSMLEPDTSATETITLIPPTGLMRSRRPIVYIMEATKTGIEVMSIVGLVVAIVLAIGAGTVYTTRRVQRRRIK